MSTNHGSIIFAVIYRHPKADFKNFEDYLCKILVKLENKKQLYVVSYGVPNVSLQKREN